MRIYFCRNNSDKHWGTGRIPRYLPGSVNQRFLWLGPIFVLIQGRFA